MMTEGSGSRETGGQLKSDTIFANGGQDDEWESFFLGSQSCLFFCFSTL